MNDQYDENETPEEFDNEQDQYDEQPDDLPEYDPDDKPLDTPILTQKQFTQRIVRWRKGLQKKAAERDQFEKELTEEREQRQKLEKELATHRKFRAMETALNGKCIDVGNAIKIYWDCVQLDETGNYVMETPDSKLVSLSDLPALIPDYLKPASYKTGGSGLQTGFPKMRNTEIQNAEKAYQTAKSKAMKTGHMSDILESERLRKVWVALKEGRI